MLPGEESYWLARFLFQRGLAVIYLVAFLVAVDQFQAENQELALVVEDGAVVGTVTVTDLLESVTGDIEDPIDTDALAADRD